MQDIEIFRFGQLVVLTVRGDLIRPVLPVRDLIDQLVHRVLGLCRDLHSERAALVQQPQHLFDALLVTGQPLQTGIREHQVVPLLHLPKVMRRVERDKFQIRMHFARMAQHVRRIVRADNPCVRKVFRDHLCTVADAAADIQNGFRLSLDRTDKVEARKCTLFFKPAVKLRVPVRHTGCLLSKR